MLKYIGIICFAALFLVSCKKEQPQMTALNKECDCAKEVSAEFVMEEKTSLTNSDVYTNTDTIYAEKNVRFTAQEDSADYTWYIGSEVLHSKSFSRYFSEDLIGQTIPVSLVVKKKANIICLPNDDGYDSLKKILIIGKENPNSFDSLISYPFEGIYKVKEINGIDSVLINFDFIFDPLYGYGFWQILNYDGLETNCNHQIHNFSVNYRQLFIEKTTNCNHLQGYLHNKLDGSVEILFHTGTTISGSFTKTYHYFGRKL